MQEEEAWDDEEVGLRVQQENFTEGTELEEACEQGVEDDG